MDLAFDDTIKQPLLFAPPVGHCLEGCVDADNIPRRLTTHNHPTSVKHITMSGVRFAQKIGLRCESCKTNYNLTSYGEKDKFRHYDTEQPIIETTDGVLTDRDLFQQYCSLQ